MNKIVFAAAALFAVVSAQATEAKKEEAKPAEVASTCAEPKKDAAAPVAEAKKEEAKKDAAAPAAEAKKEEVKTEEKKSEEKK